MSEFVTEDDLTRARQDPAFRQKLMADSLEMLLQQLNRMRAAAPSPGTPQARQIKEGVDLAVRLADRIAKLDAGDSSPAAA